MDFPGTMTIIFLHFLHVIPESFFNISIGAAKGADSSGKAFGPGQKLCGVRAEADVFIQSGLYAPKRAAPAFSLEAGENKILFLFIKTDFHGDGFGSASGQITKGYTPDTGKDMRKGVHMGIVEIIRRQQLHILNRVKAEGG